MGDHEREARITAPGGPWCDKAWHRSEGQEPRRAVVVLRCADCGRVYARCDICQRTSHGEKGAAHQAMRAHRSACHRVNHELRRRVLPRERCDG